MLDMLPRTDISKKINSKLLAKFEDKKWDKRKEAADDVHAILKEAAFRIENNGLNDLSATLKKTMKDANKASLKACI